MRQGHAPEVVKLGAGERHYEAESSREIKRADLVPSSSPHDDLSRSPPLLALGDAYGLVAIETVQRQTPAATAPGRPQEPSGAAGSMRRVDIGGLRAGSERATVLIPPRLLGAEQVEAMVWLHGYQLSYPEPRGRAGAARRETDEQRRGRGEMAWVERQLEASGRAMLGILPHGTQTSGFGGPSGPQTAGFDTQAYVSEVLQQLVETGIWEQAPRLAGVVLAGHSGAGGMISEMMSGRNPAHFPAVPALMEINLFDAINGFGQEQLVENWVIHKLEEDLDALTGPFVDPQAQAAYLATGIRFRAHHTRQLLPIRDRQGIIIGYHRYYAETHEALGNAIAVWFAAHAAELGGPGSPVYDELWQHYQVIDTGDEADGAHDRLVGAAGPAAGSRELLLKALGELPVVGQGTGSAPGVPLSRMINDTATPQYAIRAIAVLQRSAGNAAVAAMLQRQAAPGAAQARTEYEEFNNTPLGNFRRYPAAGADRTNSANRPLFITPRSVLAEYTGPGASGRQSVHPAVMPDLEALMAALHAEGQRINDASMIHAEVANAHRESDLHEGQLYLDALNTTIRQHPEIFAGRTLPPELEAQAREELGPVGSPRHNEFLDAVERAWGDASLARRLISITAHFKAPRGASAHHSGLTVDVNFPYVAADGHVEPGHDMHREHNADASRSAAGRWLNEHSRDYGFASYSTASEVWHLEWLRWRGTEADPARSQSPAGSP